MKEEMSRSYIERQKSRHASKLLRSDTERSAIIFGAERPGSIGEAIAHRLRGRGFAPVKTPTKAELNVRNGLEMAAWFWGTTADTLICCQGETHLDWIEDQPLERIESVIGSTLIGSVLATSLFARATMYLPYRKQIVMIGSMAYSKVLNASAPYCAAKAGLAHYGKCLAWELAPKGFDVFTINPSNVEGAPMTDETIQGIARYRNVSEEEATAYWSAGKVREEWLTPEDIAGVVSGVLSDIGNGYLSGSNLDLSGGGR